MRCQRRRAVSPSYEAGDDGVGGEGPRRRKAYRITDAGLDEVRRWLSAGEVDHTMRLQPLLRSLFFWLMDTDELRRHLDEEARFYARASGSSRRSPTGRSGPRPCHQPPTNLSDQPA